MKRQQGKTSTKSGKTNSKAIYQYYTQMWRFGLEDLLAHYSVELLFINVAIGPFCHPFSLGEGWWSGL